MLEKFKNTSLITKLLYLLAIIVFVAWVLPIINSYYSNVSQYQQSTEELKNIARKHQLHDNTEKFSKEDFQKEMNALFSEVQIKALGEKKYLAEINMKKEDLDAFHNMVKTISLRYYVQINNNLEFTSNDQHVNVIMNLEAL